MDESATPPGGVTWPGWRETWQLADGKTVVGWRAHVPGSTRPKAPTTTSGSGTGGSGGGRMLTAAAIVAVLLVVSFTSESCSSPVGEVGCSIQDGLFGEYFDCRDEDGNWQPLDR